MAFLPSRRREAPRGRHAPKLWSVWLVAPLTLFAVGALSFFLYRNVYDLLDHAANSEKPRKPVNINDVIKTTVTVLTLIGAVLAGIYAYRKQLLAEGDAHRADSSQLADRYTTAAEQLGHDQAAVRLAGVYALARLADDWEEQRQVCIDVLCAYLRMPYDPDPAAAGHKAGEREVRYTILRVIRDHLRHLDPLISWRTYDFDFTGSTFDGGDLSGSAFCGNVSLKGAEFIDGTVNFNGAQFNSGTVTFDDARFTGGMVDFDAACFAGGTVNFNGARFSGRAVTFNGAHFTGATVTFHLAEFGGTTVSFHLAEFNDGTVTFWLADFNDGRVDFDGAHFRGGTITFDGARFNGAAVIFHVAEFSGATVIFELAKFNDGGIIFERAQFTGGTVAFTGAQFSGATVAFHGAHFSGATATFKLAMFSGGTVTFDEAHFSDGTVTFERASAGGASVTFDGAQLTGGNIVWGEIPQPALYR